MECQSDPETIDLLRLVTERYASSGNAAPTEVVMMNPRLASSLHPSELPPCFVVPVLWWATPHETWKDCRGSYTAVRSGAVAVVVDASSPPRYVGVKRILQFHDDGANTGWKLVLYSTLDNNSVIEDKMTFCKVFSEPKGDRNTSKKKKKFAAGKQPCNPGATSSSSSPTIQVPPAPLDPSPTFFDECDKMINDFNAEEHPIYGDMQMDDMFSPSLDDDTEIPVDGQHLTNYCINEVEEEEEAVPVVPPVGNGGRRRQKRKRSPAWEHFTEIHTNDPKNVYAACHLCDCMLKAHSKTHGTSNLNDHYSNHVKRAI